MKPFLLAVTFLFFSGISAQHLKTYNISNSSGIFFMTTAGNLSYQSQDQIVEQDNNYKLSYSGNFLNLVSLELSVTDHISSQLYYGQSIYMQSYYYEDSSNNLSINPSILMIGFKTLYHFSPNNFGPYIGIGFASFYYYCSCSGGGSYPNATGSYFESVSSKFSSAEYFKNIWSIETGVRYKVYADNYFVIINVAYYPSNDLLLATLGFGAGIGDEKQ